MNNDIGVRPSFILWALWLSAAIIAVVLYSRGLPGEFVFDDFVNIRDNPYIKIDRLSWDALLQAWHASPYEFPNNRPLAYLSFGINHALAGLSPGSFKLVNLVIHLLSGALLLLFLQRLLAAATLAGSVHLSESRQLKIAGAVAILWLLHPINLTSVLYAVQRMASLSGLFVLLALSSYLGIRVRQLRGQATRAAGASLIIVLATLIGMLVKENAALVPLFIVVIEWTLLRAKTADGTVSRPVYITAGLLLAGLLTLAVLVLMIAPNAIIGGYSGREFTLSERLLTETRILWMYLGQLALPVPQAFSLFHDYLSPSKDLFTPVSTFFSVIAWVALIATALSLPRRFPLLAFAVLFFLVGHLLESSVIALELAHEHRNYIAAIGPLLFAMALLIDTVQNAFGQRLLRWLALAWLVLAASSTGLRADSWKDRGTLFQNMALAHPDSPRANFMAGIVYTSQIGAPTSLDDPRYLGARLHFIRAAQSSPNNVDGLMGLVFLQLHAGKHPGAPLLSELEHRLRTARFSPERLSLAQFQFLADWQGQEEATRLSADAVHRIYLSALSNRSIRGAPKAAVHDGYRAYLQTVEKDLTSALAQARKALALWPHHLRYYERVIDLNLLLGNMDAAHAALVELQSNVSASQAPDLGAKLVEHWQKAIAAAQAKDP